MAAEIAALRAVRRILLAATLVIARAGQLHATMVQPMGLERVAHEAESIVRGTVTDVRSGRDESGLPATWITLDVTRTLKGPTAPRMTFKQYGVSTPLPDGTVTRVSGLPRYAVGEDVVLFLRGTSRRGFTSPVGLAEGVYRVSRGRGRPWTGSDLPSGDRRAGDLDTFLAEVARLAAEHP